MPGSRGKDFRGGDLAEGLGLELLRPFAFIAPVPRPEDVGIDAVATVFRPDNHRLIAEDSFLVQVKAASIRKIQYGGEQLDWLRTLKLPFFWLRKRVISISREQRIGYASAGLQRHASIHGGLRHDNHDCSGTRGLVGTRRAGVFTSRRTATAMGWRSSVGFAGPRWHPTDRRIGRT